MGPGSEASDVKRVAYDIVSYRHDMISIAYDTIFYAVPPTLVVHATVSYR